MSSQRSYDWGDPVRPRIDWGLIAFLLGYGVLFAVLFHVAMKGGL